MHRFISNILAIVVAIPLAISGFYHLDNQFIFLSTIYGYRLVNESVGILLATAIPIAQIAIAAILLFDARNRQTTFFIASLLFLVFTIAQISAWVRGLNISCGCFGASDDLVIGVQTILIPVGCLFVSLFGVYFCRRVSTIKDLPS